MRTYSKAVKASPSSNRFRTGNYVPARVIFVSSNTTSIGLWETPGRKEPDSTNPPVKR